ncbi:hypothetical protein [Nannocystis sp.]|uniref:hypothetical protein n=1 Tax=Nannocystis sp. TaxID=1962667 RepID=UPI0025D6C8B7|nr:hypothetical protein [Nannocystis sp.]MBK7830045.1 hypothetical protein [Nannocystis sp.]
MWASLPLAGSEHANIFASFAVALGLRRDLEVIREVRGRERGDDLPAVDHIDLDAVRADLDR